GVSTILLNDIDNNSTYKNYAEAKKSMITNSVLPHLVDLRDLYNFRLVPLFEKRDKKRYFLDLDLSSIPELMPDMTITSDVAAKAWWLTIDQKLEIMGYAAHDDPEVGSKTLIPSNLIPLDEASLAFSPSDETLQEGFADDNVVNDEEEKKMLTTNNDRTNGRINSRQKVEVESTIK
ncbi:MAG: hypothetical protein ACC656_12480, partial [Candidatus Heimdallarchaeota archaeon]